LERAVKNLLPRKYTLEDLLCVDPIGTIHREQDEAIASFNKLHPALLSTFQNVARAQAAACRADPGLVARSNEYRITTKSGRRSTSLLLNLPLEDVLSAYEYHRAFVRMISKITPRGSLIRSWYNEKKRVSIVDVGKDNFPTTITRPMLVLYSADWCPPCRIMRPTFARLVSFFDKADVRYCHDDEWRITRGVKFIPQFVAYFPDGSSVSAHVGSTTQQVWDTMNNLIMLGKNFKGHGTLTCTDEKCEINPTPTP
jgi:thiol-disulfide isomerase/thioredoxin